MNSFCTLPKFSQLEDLNLEVAGQKVPLLFGLDSM